MPKKGYKQTPEHTAKCHTPEINIKIAVAMTGKKQTQEHITKIHTPESNIKRSVSLTGKKKPPRTPEHNVNQSAAQKIAHSRPEVKIKHSIAMSGHNNHNWMGGISREPYAWEFNDELKEEVRRRDNYTCQKCNTPQAECKKRLPVHHIDYDKKNSDPVNLIALCISCNTKVNKNRKHWAAYFQAMAINRDIKLINRRS